MDTQLVHENTGPLMEAPASFEELQRRSKFTAPIDPKQHKLAEVLTPYSFTKEAPCGLTTCQQGHLHGFLVRTESGIETNIGHVCGKRYFGEDFEVANATYKRAADRRDTVARVLALREQAPAIIQRVQELIDGPFGVRWVFAVRAALRRQMGPTVFSHFAQRAERGDYAVEKVIELSEAEIKKAMRDTNRKREQVQYVTEQLGRLPSLDFLFWDFKEELLNGISEPFRAAHQIDTSAETRAIRQRLRRFSGWEARLQLAQTKLADARRFLEPSSLAMTDIAAAVFMGDTGHRPEYRPMAEWAQSSQYQDLLTGVAKESTPVPPSTPKQVSKGMMRKLRRKGRRG